MVAFCTFTFWLYVWKKKAYVVNYKTKRLEKGKNLYVSYQLIIFDFRVNAFGEVFEGLQILTTPAATLAEGMVAIVNNVKCLEELVDLRYNEKIGQ